METTTPKVIVQAVSRETLCRALCSLRLERFEELRMMKQLESSKIDLAEDREALTRRLEPLGLAIAEIESALGYA